MSASETVPSWLRIWPRPGLGGRKSTWERAATLAAYDPLQWRVTEALLCLPLALAGEL